MEVFRGKVEDPQFQQWLERLMRKRRNLIIIGADDISCYEARTTLEQISSSQYLFSHHRENLKKALIHITICERDQRCRHLLQALRPN